MRYMGSKRRIGKEIFEIMKQDSGLSGGNWVEPFVGGGNMIQYVQPDMFGQWVRYGNDVNKYVVACLKAYAGGWCVPYDEISEELYKDIKNNKNRYPDELVGFSGICCAFGGGWGCGYARDSKKNNYTGEGHRSLKNQSPLLLDITWSSGNYDEMKLPEPDATIIYCDPPYKGTAGYKVKFDHEKFYQWCRDKSKEGHKVYISEYNMPDDFELIHEIELSCDIDKRTEGKDTKRIEKLFKCK